MKTIQYILCLYIIFISTITFGQDNNKAWMIRYDLISLLGDQVTNSMGVMLGVEHLSGNNKSFAIDIMYIFPCSRCEKPYTSISAEKTNGVLLSVETRYYLFPGKASFSGFHLGPQIYYQYTRSEMRETYDGGIENFYQVNRNLLAAHAMAGYQLQITGPLFFNPSIGLGLRYISSWNENKKGTDSGQHEYPYNKDFESGSKWFPSFTINIKIGLKL
jgi:hypothetical protein